MELYQLKEYEQVKNFMEFHQTNCTTVQIDYNLYTTVCLFSTVHFCALGSAEYITAAAD